MARFRLLQETSISPQPIQRRKPRAWRHGLPYVFEQFFQLSLQFVGPTSAFCCLTLVESDSRSCRGRPFRSAAQSFNFRFPHVLPDMAASADWRPPCLGGRLVRLTSLHNARKLYRIQGVFASNPLVAIPTAAGCRRDLNSAFDTASKTSPHSLCSSTPDSETPFTEGVLPQMQVVDCVRLPIAKKCKDITLKNLCGRAIQP